jgi:hypothetical protein
LEAFSKRNESKAHCDGPACDATGVQLVEDGKSAGTISTFAFGIGLAAMVGGAVVWFTAPRKSTAYRIAPIATHQGGGVVLGGQF